MKKLGILLSSPSEIGGIYQYSLSMIEALKFFEKKKIYKVNYFYTNKLWEKHIPSSAQKIFIKNSLFKKFLKKIINFFFGSIFSNTVLKNFLNEEVQVLNQSDTDLLIFPSQNMTCYQVDKKNFTSIHDLMFKFYPKISDFSKKIIFERNMHYKNIVKKASGILVDSKIGKNHIKKFYKSKSNKIFILPFIVPSYLKKSKNYNIKKKYNIHKDYILYPAQFWEHKNHIRLIKAFEKILKKDENIVLVLCGSKKNFFYQIENYIKQKKLINNVLYIGRVDDEYMYSLYKNSKLVVYPSLFGPTNIPPLEAIFCKVPVVCSGIFGMKDQLKTASLYFNPLNVNDIYKKIDFVLRNKTVRKKLISEGKKIIKENNQKKFNFILKSYISNFLKN